MSETIKSDVEIKVAHGGSRAGAGRKKATPPKRVMPDAIEAATKPAGLPMPFRRSERVPPAYLKPETQAWFQRVCEGYDLEDHHVRLLTAACEAWDRLQQAREILSSGLTYEDRFGAPRAKPEVAIERDSRVAFTRLVRELDLDVEPPAEGPRVPGLRSNRRL